ncbi:MAG: von Willebrand factor type A domain-containing protein [Candidatus Kapabacteria bacterium]|jgi:Ca-activated chloride channel family protein|nr:von Willebrand factor type A domain-containing protein [Candidatus Kapabacteria bacterium]
MKTIKRTRFTYLVGAALFLAGVISLGAIAFASNFSLNTLYGSVGTIQGVVLNTADSKPLAGAKVRLGKTLVATTDAKGTYTLHPVPAGIHSLTISATDFKRVLITDITVKKDSVTLINAWLSPGIDDSNDDLAARDEAKQPPVQTSPTQPWNSQREADTRPPGTMEELDGGRASSMNGAAPPKSIGFGHDVLLSRKPSSEMLRSMKMSTVAQQTSLPVDVEHNTEEYAHQNDNEYLLATQNPLSTFSIDVDNAAYSNMRRYLTQRQMPPKDAIRSEELVNYFRYDYPQPRGTEPFSVNTEYGACPWNTQHKLVHIGLQGKQIPLSQLPASNLVFLIDVSGSMDSPEKLPLLKDAFTMLTKQLRPQDRVAIVVYAGAAGVVLSPTDGSDKNRIFAALNNLSAGGSTAGGEGIKLAYHLARQYFIKGGNNRVILATDGDFNVGTSSEGDLVRLIEKERESGVFLTVLGFGMGNYKDSKMEKLADKGNGNYAYIDNAREAERVLVGQMQGTLYTIAKDVKIQVEFNPSQVQAYRLIGYENRLLAKEDFNNDTKDAGEIGAGHTVTALYEIVPVGVAFQNPSGNGSVDALKYQTTQQQKPLEIKIVPNISTELMTVKIRYKESDGTVSKLLERPVPNIDAPLQAASQNFKFSAAVAEFAMILRESPFKAQASYNQVLSLASESLGKDTDGYRAEFIRLVETAQMLTSGVVRNR